MNHALEPQQNSKARAQLKRDTTSPRKRFPNFPPIDRSWHHVADPASRTRRTSANKRFLEPPTSETKPPLHHSAVQLTPNISENTDKLENTAHRTKTQHSTTTAKPKHDHDGTAALHASSSTTSNNTFTAEDDTALHA